MEGPTPATGGLPLVFGSEGNVVAMSLDGKTRRQLTRVPSGANARDPMWAPDGATIVYAYSPPMSAARGPGGLLALPTTDLYVMNADGSDAKPLVRSDGAGIGYETPVWSPDGTAVYVTYTELLVESSVVRDQKVEVARIPVSGGPRQTLIPDAVFPTVSPDGKRLACLASGPDGQFGQTLLVAAADGTGARALLPPRADGFASPRFSPDGRLIAFAQAAPLAPVPTTTVPPGYPTPAPPPGPATPPPGRSGDGGAGRPLGSGASGVGWTTGAARGPLALLRPRPARAHGLPMDVFVCSAGGEDLRRLTQLGEDSPAPVWAPDGRRMAFVAGGGVYVMNADGSDLTHVTHQGGHGAMDWRRA